MKNRGDDTTAQVPTASRTLVIVLAEIVVIVALVVVWSVLRGRQRP